MWDRLSPEARKVMRMALAESEQLGHAYVGHEHVLLGLLRHRASQASSLLLGHGLDLASARAELQRLSAAGLIPRPCADDAGVADWLASGRGWVATGPKPKSNRTHLPPGKTGRGPRVITGALMA
jgi:hypothetical protein